MFLTKRFTLLGAILGAISLTPISISPALAAIAANVTATTSFSSGTFIAYAALPPFPASNPMGALGIPVSMNVGKDFIIESDSRNLNINSFTMTISLGAAGAITNLKNCGQGILFSGSTSTCISGGVTTNTPTAGSAKTYTLSLPANSFYEFQLLENRNTTATISVSVSSTQISTFTQNS